MMAKVIVIFGSTTGNTEVLAQSVTSGLREGGAEVSLKNVLDASVGELADYAVVVLGSSTWYEGELQDDFVPFYDKMDDLSLAGEKAAVFGTGDREGYPDTFCTAVDMLEKRLKECGAEIIAESLKIDKVTGDDMDEADRGEAKTWALNIAKSI
jgi:flavodoxin I